MNLHLTSTPPQPAPALALRGLRKAFDGVRALDGASLEIARGEVHGLLGENGSGKSTLIKVLAGFHMPDEGHLEVAGQNVDLPLSPGQFRSLGFDFVHQDLGLIPSLTVLENLRISAFVDPDSRWRISWREQRRAARELLRSNGVDLPLDRQIGELRPIDRALLAIVRAIDGMRERPGKDGPHARLLVLDEPTVFLPRSETEQLFQLVRGIVADGGSVLFVSHDLDEVAEITDRITVLRDGRTVGTVETQSLQSGELVRLIIGRELAEMAPPAARPTAAKRVAVVNGLASAMLDDVSFAVHDGEVLGLTGLVGSGFDDVPYLLYGAQGATAGTIELRGVTWSARGMTPADALDAGMVLIPADRARDASIGSLSVTENLTMPTLDEHFRGLRLDWRAMHASSAALMEDFDVRPRRPDLTYSTLSGGNQQKVVLAKWLQTNPGLLLMHEPTQGVDVGARHQIHDVVRGAAVSGTAVVCASADYGELAVSCDRVLIFRKGRIAAELTGSDISKERITQQCLSV